MLHRALSQGVEFMVNKQQPEGSCSVSSARLQRSVCLSVCQAVSFPGDTCPHEPFWGEDAPAAASHSPPQEQQASPPRPLFYDVERNQCCGDPLQLGGSVRALCVFIIIINCGFFFLFSEETGRERKKSLSFQNHSSFLIMKAVTSSAW